MSQENSGASVWNRWTPTNATATKTIGVPGARVVVKGVIVNSHTSGTFRFSNGTATNWSATGLGGTYTPATGSSVILFEPIDFTSGCFFQVGGTLDATVLYNDFN